MDFVTNSAVGGSGDGILRKNALTTQLLRVMRLTAFILLVFALTVSAKSVSQNTVSYSGRNVPIGKVFNEIKKQTGYVVVTNKERFDRSEKINVSADKMSIADFMQMILEGKPWDFEIRSKTIFIKEKPAAQQKTSELNAVRSPQGDVTGRVTNAQGEPLAGASVIVKRTGKGDIADANGNFKLKNVNTDDVLEISFTGYKTLSSKIDGASVLALVLDVAVDELDRAVVQAYGKTTQRLATGNIAKVTAQEIERQPVMNPLLALQGKVAGLDITQTSGYVSAPIKIELRGRSFISNSYTADPHIIIDGVPLTINETGGLSSYNRGTTGFFQSGFGGPAGGQNPLFSINPSHIESIEVLKDADASAIYGSRGANGVILITTKKGKAGKTKADLSIQQGITQVTRYWKMMNTQQYLQMRHEAINNDGFASRLTPQFADIFYDLLRWDTTRYTDWQRELYGRTGKTTNVQAGISGGNVQTNFRIGAGYNRTTNIQTVSGADQRASFALNTSHLSLNSKFSASLSGIYSYTQSDMIDMPYNVTLPPNAPPIYDSVGNLNYAGWGAPNSRARNVFNFDVLKQPYIAKTNFLNGNLILTYSPIKGLRLSTSLGYNSAQADNQNLILIASQDQDPSFSPEGRSRFGFNSNENWIIEPQATYTIVVGKGTLSLLTGSSVQSTKTSALFIQGQNYTSDDLIGSISNAPVITSTDRFGEYKYAAFFARINYNWQNKYLLNLNARRDGSSRFGPGKQYGNFGSIGLGWIFTEENFIKSYLPFISFGKIRGSYGTTGSDAIGDYQFLTQWSSTVTPLYSGISALAPTLHANPNFQWQVNKKLEGGWILDFSTTG